MVSGPGQAFDKISLRLPGDPEYGSIARTAAMALGLRAGFDWPVLQALALAVDETMVLLLDRSRPTRPLDLTFTISDDRLALEVRQQPALPEDPHSTVTVDPQALQRFGDLIEGAVTEWSVGPETATVHLLIER